MNRIKNILHITHTASSALWPILRLNYSKNTVGQQITAVLRILIRDQILCLFWAHGSGIGNF
jgi:hypothetical protein